VTEPAAPGRGRQKAIGVAAGALASVVAVSGVAVASTQSLPGDPFYGVKRTAEGLQLRLAGDRVEEGERHLQFAATRLDEIRGLAFGRNATAVAAQAAADADWDGVRAALGDMDDETRRGAALLEQAWFDDRDTEALTLLSDFAAQQMAALRTMLPAMAPEARGHAEASLGLIGQVAASTSELLGLAPCTQACASGGSSGSADADCDCDSGSGSGSGSGPSSSPRPSASPGASRSAEPSPSPSGSAPTTEPSMSDPGGTTAPPPAPPPSPQPTVPTLPPPPAELPTQLPTELPTDLSSPTVPAPSTELLPDVLPG
jgi:hypothetical protein